jgi:ACT domain-containing protein
MAERAVITVLGSDKIGIVAGITEAIAKCGGNIIDISQTILREFFAMIMLVEVDQSFDLLKQSLDAKSEELGVQIMVQHEDVFKYMHRI